MCWHIVLCRKGRCARGVRGVVCGERRAVVRGQPWGSGLRKERGERCSLCTFRCMRLYARRVGGGGPLAFTRYCYYANIVWCIIAYKREVGRGVENGRGPVC